MNRMKELLHQWVDSLPDELIESMSLEEFNRLYLYPSLSNGEWKEGYLSLGLTEDQLNEVMRSAELF